MTSIPAMLNPNMPMKKVMEVFEDTQWYLPVVDENKGYLGFMSKSNFFDSYPTCTGSFFRRSRFSVH